MVARHDRRGAGGHIKTTPRASGVDGDVASGGLNGPTRVHHQAPSAQAAASGITGLNIDVAVRLDRARGAFHSERMQCAGIEGCDVNRTMGHQK